MKFVVTRTSCFEDGEEGPCKGAFKEEYIRIDERAIDDPMKNNFIGAAWYTEGRNHRVEDGNIKRDFLDVTWFIEFNSLDDLLQFTKEHGRVVIQPFYFNPIYTEIEIYDDYRE